MASPYATVTPSDLAPGQRWVFDGQPFHLILNLAVGGSWPGAPNASTPLPSTLSSIGSASTNDPRARRGEDRDHPSDVQAAW